jgi:hypothetical protein
MSARNSGRFVHTLLQLAQKYNGKQALNEIESQIDSFIRNNNILSSEFQARANALDTSKIQNCTFLHLYHYKRLIQNCSELNEKLDGLGKEIKRQDFDASFQMIRHDLWPVVWEIGVSVR